MVRRLTLVLIALIAVTLIVISLLQSAPSETDAQTASGETVTDRALAQRRGALVDEVVFTEESDAGRITALIERGSHQVFAHGVTNSTIFRQIQASKKVSHHLSYGTSVELTLNPAGPHFDNGKLNPFHVPAIREALNRLVDRRHVAEELFGGLAVPRYLPLNTAFPDYARLADTARALELRYRHDPEAAETTIHRHMERLGARLQDGQWRYEGEPVRITVLIRTEDERERAGDYIANLLEDIGFQVERLYRTAEEASRLWLASDPSTGRWHIYTGAWISTVINRDVGNNLSNYYTPRGRPDPLWQAYDPDPELAEIAEQLERREYTSMAERKALMARGLELAMADSARIWLVDQLNVWPHAADVTLSADLAGGVAGSALWPYTLRYKDRLGGRMTFATPSMLTEPWNPVAGSNWLYDQMIINALQDSVVLPDPFTGLYWPQRIDSAAVTVQEDAPVERNHDWLSLDTQAEIPVPADAWIDWDAQTGQFITVGDKHPGGLTARARTVVQYEEDFLDRRWHDGSRVSMADIVLPWILTFARADEDSQLHDAAYMPQFEVFQRHFRGWRIVSKAPLTIEIYSDQIYPDAETIVAQRAPTPQPWHVLALGIEAERAGSLAFSSNKADQLEVEWTNLVAGPSLAILRRHLEQARQSDHTPYAGVLDGLLRQGEVTQRYDNLAAWHRARGHFWVGNGPFYLHSVRPVEGTVVLRRFDNFPDPADKWLRFTDPKIPELEVDGPLAVELDQTMDVDLRITFEDEPYPTDEIKVVRFLLFDGADDLVKKGRAQAGNSGRWHITLSAQDLARLGTGANSLEIAVTTDNVALPAFASHAFATVPTRAQTPEEAP